MLSVHAVLLAVAADCWKTIKIPTTENNSTTKNTLFTQLFCLCNTLNYTYCNSTTPQELKQYIDTKRSEALAWRAQGPGGGQQKAAAAGGSSGANQAQRAPRQWAEKLSVARAKPFKPQVPGCCIWHEAATDRVRITYTNAGRTQSFSYPVQKNEHEAVLATLRWAWKQHVDAGYEGPPEAWQLS